MEKSNKRGKIPQSDWPLIMTRYEAGETLASIARTYDCSPPAISYVVSKSRARRQARDKLNASPGERESQLVKAAANESTEAGFAKRLHPDQQAAAGAGRNAQLGATPDRNGVSAPQHPGVAREARGSHATDGFNRDGFAERAPQPIRGQASAGAGNGK